MTSGALFTISIYCSDNFFYYQCVTLRIQKIKKKYQYKNVKKLIRMRSHWLED